MPAVIEDLPLVGLAYSEDHDLLYAVERRSSDLAIRRIHRFNADGASLGPIDLVPPVPLTSSDRDGLQLEYGSGSLFLLLPSDAAELAGDQRILVVDPLDGRVSVPAG